MDISHIKGRLIQDILSSIEERERRKAEKRTRFLELLNDPELEDLVTALFQSGQNGTQNGHAVTVEPMKPSKPGKRTGLKEAIRNLQLPSLFSANDVYDHLTSDGFQFPDQQDVKGSIRDALLSLRTDKNPEIKIAVQGKANTPHLYEWIRRTNSK